MPPAMRPPRRGVSYSEALARTYAVAPEDEIALDTLELLHPMFVDEEGDPVAVRVVNDHIPLTATLEADAPLNPGATVEFKNCYFEFKRPREDESGQVPELELRIDNVARILIPYLELIKLSRTPVTAIFRPYLPSDLSGPHMNPPLTLTLKNVGGDMSSLHARASVSELTNRRFPASEYTARKFPGLVAR